MTAPWLNIIGIGEDGVDGLSPQARLVLSEAEIIIGGDRHHRLADISEAVRIRWPSPFDALIEDIRSYRGRKLAILVTGDPLWYSVGARISRSIDPAEIVFHPQLSAFQWACARLGWSIADCDTLTVHGRPNSQILPHLAPRARLLVLTQNGQSPRAIADLLIERGFGDSKMVALAALGGVDEQVFTGLASDWNHTVPDFHTLAVECVASADAAWYGRTGGLPDEAFVSDGQMTKQDVRSVTLAKLAPFPDAVLWDIGAGCGSVSIEWMRAARGALSVAIEPDDDRRRMIVENARNLGAEKIVVVSGSAPSALQNLAVPDAIFIGGGLSRDGVFDAAYHALPVGGRMVANAVTLESESILLDLHRRLGGDLVRLGVQKARAVGGFRGWNSAMPVTQWSVIKRGEVKS